MPGAMATLSLRQEVLKSALDVVWGFDTCQDPSYIQTPMYNAYTTELFDFVWPLLQIRSTFGVANLNGAPIQSLVAQDPIQVLLSRLCVFHLSRCHWVDISHLSGRGVVMDGKSQNY